jgi:D-sedoheptulose 7-phosphate isomerase
MNHREIAQIWAQLLEDFFERRGQDFEKAVAACVGALAAGRKIMAFGNGGSAAEAQHFAAELVNKFRRTRPALRAISLTTDTSVLTCLGNDVDFDSVFSRQIEALGDPGDIALALSTSGRSRNVLAALTAARSKKIVTIGLAGLGGGPMGPLCDYVFDIATEDTPRIQEIHLYLLHRLAEEIENRTS